MRGLAAMPTYHRTLSWVAEQLRQETPDERNKAAAIQPQQPNSEETASYGRDVWHTFGLLVCDATQWQLERRTRRSSIDESRLGTNWCVGDKLSPFTACSRLIWVFRGEIHPSWVDEMEENRAKRP
jgi:hypothetical protein